MRGRLKDYFLVAKPGIVFGNLFTMAGGFFLAARGEVDISRLLWAMVGLMGVVASSCVFNCYIDRDIDREMARTRNRPLACGRISCTGALFYAVVLALAGLGTLVLLVSVKAALCAGFGMAVYVGIYSLWAKRNSTWGTFLGSFSGAMPPLVGYCAGGGGFDSAAAILLASFVFWQMPHSYAIALMHRSDYSRIHLPVLPLVAGVNIAKHRMFLYVALYGACAALLTLGGYTGSLYLLVMLAISALWLIVGWFGFRVGREGEKRWARRMFLISIVAVLAMSVTMAVDFVPVS